MADQKRWFKVWHSILDDDDILALPPQDRWSWIALGAYMVVHGSHGSVTIRPTNPSLAVAFGCQPSALIETLRRLPHVRIEEGKSDNGRITVSFDNWHKYQEDSTAYERVKRLRSKRRGEEIRGEEKRREEKTPPTPSLGAVCEISPDALASIWNEEAPTMGLAAVLSVTPARKKKLAARIRAYPKLEFWKNIFLAIGQSPFLLGNGDGGWRASFDWVFANDENVLKIAEGKYAGRKLSPGEKTRRNFEAADREEMAKNIL